jgi:hypothetical protein
VTLMSSVLDNGDIPIGKNRVECWWKTINAHVSGLTRAQSTLEVTKLPANMLRGDHMHASISKALADTAKHTLVVRAVFAQFMQGKETKLDRGLRKKWHDSTLSKMFWKCSGAEDLMTEAMKRLV